VHRLGILFSCQPFFSTSSMCRGILSSEYMIGNWCGANICCVIFIRVDCMCVSLKWCFERMVFVSGWMIEGVLNG